MAMEFEMEEFEEWIRQGLKISHGMNLDPFWNEEIPSLVPTSPMGFAMVEDKDAIDAFADDSLSFPLMIPLPLNRLSMSVSLKAYANCVFVSLTVFMSVQFVKPGHLSTFFLALPIPDPGILKSIRVSIPDSSKPDLKPITMANPMFNDVFFIQRNEVEGGVEVESYVTYLVKLPPADKGFFSIPMSYPFYANNFRGESKDKEHKKDKKCKIKLCLNAREGQCFHNYHVNFPLKVVIKEEQVVHLLQQSEGPRVEWPEEDLHCNYTLMDQKKVESAEPVQKKARVTK